MIRVKDEMAILQKNVFDHKYFRVEEETITDEVK